jgi:hypothetical protein
MKRVFLVKAENKGKAELALKADDLVSRGSIMLRAASSLGIEEEGYFIIIDASMEAVEKAEELLNDLGTVYENEEKVLNKIEEQEDSAIEGFGNILG